MILPRHSILAVALGVVVAACGDQGEPTSANRPGLWAAVSPTREVYWSNHILACLDGERAAQVQSVFPLDGPGNQILVGRSGSCSDSDDYLVYDLSSGEPVLLDAIDTGEEGFNLAAHSPPGSPVGFGAEGKMLVMYDGGFSLIPFPCDGDCTASGVWAGSPTDVWVVTGNPGTVGRILRWDGNDFTLEHEGGLFTAVWGFGGANPLTMYAVGDRIVQRALDGTWHEVVSPDNLPAACQDAWGLMDVVGRNPNDVWVVGFSPCILHSDGLSWAEVTPPANPTRLGGVWALDAKRILVAGQGGANSELGLIPLWGTLDGGASWIQVSDPQLIGTPGGYFALGATTGGQRILGPRISANLLLGTAGDGTSASTVGFSTSLVAGEPMQPDASGEVVLPRR